MSQDPLHSMASNMELKAFNLKVSNIMYLYWTKSIIICTSIAPFKCMVFFGILQ